MATRYMNTALNWQHDITASTERFFEERNYQGVHSNAAPKKMPQRGNYLPMNFLGGLIWCQRVNSSTTPNLQIQREMDAHSYLISTVPVA